MALTHGSLPWYIDWPDNGPRPSVKIRDFIYNLAFDKELTLLSKAPLQQLQRRKGKRDVFKRWSGPGHDDLIDIPSQCGSRQELLVCSSWGVVCVWYAIEIVDKYDLDIKLLCPWFSRWYECARLDKFKSDRICYPCWVFDHPKGFQRAIKKLVYNTTRYLSEWQLYSNSYLYLHSLVICMTLFPATNNSFSPI